LNKFKDYYFSYVVPTFIKDGLAKNVMGAPKFLKVVINVGFNGANLSKKNIDDIFNELYLISGQKPIFTKARKSVAGFKIREGVNIGCKVTLRRENMYNFLGKLVYLVLPRVRDFRGLSSKSFDGRGNYSFGLKEQIIFPEINYDKVEIIRGMDITIVTNAKTDLSCKTLLEFCCFPFN